MSKRKRSEAYIQEAHMSFLNENARASYANKGKIETVKFIKPVNLHQKIFVKSIKQNKLTIGSGCAGTGKTLLALFTGIQLINNPNSPIEKLIYVRANVDDREEKEIGALPGGLIEKVRHLAYPILDNLELFMKMSTVESLLESGRIEVLPLMMMRGRSFNNKFIIIDEAQNIAPKSLKTILTRCGEDSKMILIGDPAQCDIDPFKNGLHDLEWRMVRRVEQLKQENKECSIDFNVVKFTRDDIIRSELTRFVLDLYDL
jgi:phosphate starvation-inducible PhoH-like protein